MLLIGFFALAVGLVLAQEESGSSQLKNATAGGHHPYGPPPPPPYGGGGYYPPPGGYAPPPPPPYYGPPTESSVCTLTASYTLFVGGFSPPPSGYGPPSGGYSPPGGYGYRQKRHYHGHEKRAVRRECATTATSDEATCTSCCQAASRFTYGGIQTSDVIGFLGVFNVVSNDYPGQPGGGGDYAGGYRSKRGNQDHWSNNGGGMGGDGGGMGGGGDGWTPGAGMPPAPPSDSIPPSVYGQADVTTQAPPTPFSPSLPPSNIRCVCCVPQKYFPPPTPYYGPPRPY